MNITCLKVVRLKRTRQNHMNGYIRRSEKTLKFRRKNEIFYNRNRELLYNKLHNLVKERSLLDDWKFFSQLEIGKDTQEDIKRKFGAPDEVYTEQLGPNEEQWNYMRNGIPKIHIFYIDGISQSASIDIWDKETLTDLTKLLKEFPGKWEVVQARVEVPHAMPFLCYLVDESSGKGIEVHAYKKIAESISKWNPKLSKGHYKKPRKYPDVDENRCAWLKELIKK